jgi:hypothetical protein
LARDGVVDRRLDVTGVMWLICRVLDHNSIAALTATTFSTVTTLTTL